MSALAYVPRDAYDRLPAVNWSKLKVLGKSPAHFRHALTSSDVDTDAKKRGRATHLAVFEPERFKAECITWHDGARKGKEWLAFCEAHAGLEILTPGMEEAALAIAAAARSSPQAIPYLSGGKGEQTVQWVHETPALGGVDGFTTACKGRLDFIARAGAIVDLKTTTDASPEAFGRTCANYEYHAQGAFYVDGLAAATGQVLPYVFVVVEVAPPHVVQVYRLPEEILELGRERYRDLLRIHHRCRTESEWPGYHTEPMDLTLPRWAVPQEDDDVNALDLIIEGENT